MRPDIAHYAMKSWRCSRISTSQEENAGVLGAEGYWFRGCSRRQGRHHREKWRRKSNTFGRASQSGDRTHDGKVRIRGRVASLLEVGTGFHPELTGRENVFLNGVILGMSRGEIRNKFDEGVEFAGIEQFGKLRSSITHPGCTCAWRFQLPHISIRKS